MKNGYATVEPKIEEQFQEIEEGIIDTSQFSYLSIAELTEVLGLTIKRDNFNKILTFLALLSAYTKDSQLNISFNAPSSSGKSFIPMQIARLFPEGDVKEVGYCSPTAFFHDNGNWNPETKAITMDLSKKILIFLDQPHNQLIEHLRPLLSHDKKEIVVKITDKTQKAGMRTKNILLIGYPTVIFCTAGLELDEQEATRFLLLSPEVHQEKLEAGIKEKIRKESDSQRYEAWLEGNQQRMLLKQRIKAIKQEDITDIIIPSSDLVEELFLKRVKIFKPRHQRDIGRVLSLIKILALLNLWFRKRKGNALISNVEDIHTAFDIWDNIAQSQELNLSPFVFNYFQDIVMPAYQKGQADSITGIYLGISRQDLLKQTISTYGRPIPDWQLRQQIIPALEAAGLITQEQDPADKRLKLIAPTTLFDSQNNSELGGGVKEMSPEQMLEQNVLLSDLSNKQSDLLFNHVFGAD